MNGRLKITDFYEPIEYIFASCTISNNIGLKQLVIVTDIKHNQIRYEVRTKINGDVANTDYYHISDAITNYNII